MKAIDVFCHMMPPAYARACMDEAPNKSHMFRRAMNVKSMSDMDARDRVLEKFPGYKQIVNIVSPPVEAFAGPDKSPRLAALGNDEIRKIVEERPEFYDGWICEIPFNNVRASVEEIIRCKEMGAKGVQIYTHMNGEAIDQEKFWPIYEICEKLALPILIHPVGGQMTPEFPTEDRSRYELWFTIGWPYQTTAAMARLVFSGVFVDFPDLIIITHHVGGMIPMLAGRLENGLKMYGGRTAPELRDQLTSTRVPPEDFVKHFKKFYADTASFGAAAPIRCGLDFFGPDHIVFATDMPFDPEEGPGYISRTLDAVKLVKSPALSRLPMFFRLRDMLISDKVYLSAMLDYAVSGAGSRGSGLYTDQNGILPSDKLPELFRLRLDAGENSSSVQEICLGRDGKMQAFWREVRPIPDQDYFFENQWRRYRERRGL